MKRNMWLLLALSAVLGIGLVWAGSGWLNPATADDVVPPPPLDIAVVFDASGSMDYETTCFDCWEPVGSSDPKFDVIANPWPANGTFNPLPDATTADICLQSTQSITDTNGNKYLVHEAELYSRDVPWQGWQFEQRVAGQGFWVIQRANRDASDTAGGRGAYIGAYPFPVYSQGSVNEYPQLQGAAYNIECFNGPNLSGACWQTRAAILGEPTPLSTPPYVEYDFTPDWSGDTYVWIRAQGSGGYGWQWNGRSPADNPVSYRNLPVWRKAIFWQIGRADNSSWSDVQGRDFTNLDQSNDYRLPERNKWRWLKLGAVATTNGVQHTLRLYQGSAGFHVDKIIFTDFAGGDANTTIDASGTVQGVSTGITTAFKNFLNQNGGQGPAATPGSGAREACNICNPVFGQTVAPAQCSCKTSNTDSAASSYGAGGAGVGCTQVLSLTNNLNNDLYHDEDPIRSEKEGVKHLADLLDPAIDQLALVAFSNYVYNGTTNGIRQRAELQCLRWAAANDAQGVLKCFDPTTDPISFTQVIKSVEIHDNTNGTNIAEGLREGLEELGIEAGNNTGIDSDCRPGIDDKSVCDRQGTARRVLILLTDGTPNDDDGCPATNLWTGIYGQGRRAYDCAIYYAQQAATQNVSLFTVGLGPGYNPDLLTAMATGTDPTTGDVYFEPRCGQFFAVPKMSDLDRAFEAIVEAARNCVTPPIVPEIWSVSGYDNIDPFDPFMVHLENHVASALYDVYLSNSSNAYRICAGVAPDVFGRVDTTCTLTAVPPGLYDLSSVVAGTINPKVAVAEFQVAVVSDSGQPSENYYYFPLLLRSSEITRGDIIPFLPTE